MDRSRVDRSRPPCSTDTICRHLTFVNGFEWSDHTRLLTLLIQGDDNQLSKAYLTPEHQSNHDKSTGFLMDKLWRATSRPLISSGS